MLMLWIGRQGSASNGLLSNQYKDMKTIKFESNYGNFAYRLTANVGDDVNEETIWLAESQGLANICYRVAGSSVDKAMGVKERKALGYSEQAAEQINAAVSAKLSELEKNEKVGKFVKALKLSFAVVGQHEFGTKDDGKPTAADAAIWTAMQTAPEAKFEAACKTIGIGEEYDDDVALKAVRVWRLAGERAAKEAAQKAAMSALGM